MFRVHTPIIRNIRCWVAAYGFLHRVFGWVVVFRAAVYGADGAVHHPHRTHNLHSSSQNHHPYINKITLLHQVGISLYFMRKMHGQTTVKSLDLIAYKHWMFQYVGICLVQEIKTIPQVKTVVPPPDQPSQCQHKKIVFPYVLVTYRSL